MFTHLHTVTLLPALHRYAQEIGRQVLATASTTASHKLSAAAAAVSKLTGPQLAEGVADLADSPDDAPDALLSLLTGVCVCGRGQYC